MPPSTYLHVRKCERFGSFFPLIFCRVQQTARTNSVAFSQLCGDLIVVDVKCVVYRPRRILFAFTTPTASPKWEVFKIVGSLWWRTGNFISFVGHHAKGRFASLRLKARPSLSYLYCSLVVCAWGKRENLNRLDLEERERAKKCVRFQDCCCAFVLIQHIFFLFFSPARGVRPRPPAWLCVCYCRRQGPFPPLPTWN
jgi:hypothetical protein